MTYDDTAVSVALMVSCLVAILVLVWSLEGMNERKRRKIMAALTMSGLATFLLHGEGND